MVIQLIYIECKKLQPDDLINFYIVKNIDKLITLLKIKTFGFNG